MAEVKLENVTKSFSEGKNAIESLSLNIGDGEFVVLLGPTASGKSAVIRMISGLDEITSGELYIDDVLANDLFPKDRNVAVVFQNQQLMPMSVYDNIAMGLKMRNAPKEEINAKVREIARVLGLEDLLSRKPKTLSSLERQRVTLARAFVREPNVCMFDDTFASLDDMLTKQLRSDLIKLQYRMKTTVIFATRDQIDAMSMATKLVVLSGGKVEQVGTPQEIYCHPKTVFVATYVGSPSICLSSGTLEKTDDGVFVNFVGAKVKLTDEQVARISAIDSYLSGEKCLTVGIRGENLSITTENEGDFNATVLSVETFGDYKVAELKLSQKTLSDFCVVMAADSEVEVGATVGVKVDVDKLHLFDQMTEETIFG